MEPATRSVSRERVPVFDGPRIRELVLEGSRRYQILKSAPNVEKVQQRKTRRIVQFNLCAHGDDSEQSFPKGNPRRYSHDHETDQNPARVWTLRHLARETRPIFMQSVTDCLARYTAGDLPRNTAKLQVR